MSHRSIALKMAEMFCPYCKSLLMPGRSGGARFKRCRDCGYESRPAVQRTGLVLVFLQFLQVLRPFLEGDLLFVILYRPSNFT
jgi:hypothetical protein